MLNPRKTTWFMIADGARALLFESASPRSGWALVGEWVAPTRAPDSELGRDRPIRGRNIGTGAPFAIDAPSLHERAEAEFLEARASYLNEKAMKDAYSRLVLAAPPKALGVLRKALGQDAKERVIAEFDKDLTNTPSDKLLEYFTVHLERW
jgi:protein required for attachment to host cells